MLLKKFTSYTLLLLILFGITGVFVVFKIEQIQIKKNIKQQIKMGIPEKKLTTFIFSNSVYKHLNWKEINKEFIIENNLFDVVGIHKMKDSVQVICIDDKSETLLFAQLNDMVKRKLEQESNLPESPINKAVKLLKSVYISKIIHFQFNNCFFKIHSKNIETHSSYISPYIENLTPPPNFI